MTNGRVTEGRIRCIIVFCFLVFVCVVCIFVSLFSFFCFSLFSFSSAIVLFVSFSFSLSVWINLGGKKEKKKNFEKILSHIVIVYLMCFYRFGFVVECEPYQLRELEIFRHGNLCSE